jgi:hypothetical protein
MSTSIRCPITGFSCSRSCLQRGAQCMPDPPEDPDAIAAKLDADQRRFVGLMVRYGKLGQPGYSTDQHGKWTDQLGVTEMCGVYRYLTDTGREVAKRLYPTAEEIPV